MSFSAIDINIKATISDLSVVGVNLQTSTLTVFSARQYINTGSTDNFFETLGLVEDIDHIFNEDDSDDYGVASPRDPDTDPETPTKAAFRYRYVMALVVDLKRYYPELCRLQVLAVESRFNDRSLLSVIHGNSQIVYLINPHSDHWKATNAADTFNYTILNSDTGEMGTATITLERFADYPEFNDVYVELGPFTTGVVQIDLEKYNPAMAEWSVLGFGLRNPELISSISVAPDNPRSIILNLAQECSCWECNWTDVEVFIQNNAPGPDEGNVFKLYVNLVKPCTSFMANPILIEVVGEVPEYVDINVAFNNPHALVELLEVDQTDDNRGEVMFTPFLNSIRYLFNRSTSYWDPLFREDIFAYHIRNKATGAKAIANVIIRKIDITTSSSGSELTFERSYPILPGSTLYKVAPITAFAKYEGTILTEDNEGNQISLQAHISIQTAPVIMPKPFTGTLAGATANGSISMSNLSIVTDPEGSPLLITGGHFYLKP
jgi:hypothetical protein